MSLCLESREPIMLGAITVLAAGSLLLLEANMLVLSWGVTLSAMLTKLTDLRGRGELGSDSLSR